MLNTIIVGDALTVLRQLPDAFVDVTVTSPPYNTGERDRGWLVDRVVYEGASDSKAKNGGNGWGVSARICC